MTFSALWSMGPCADDGRERLHQIDEMEDLLKKAATDLGCFRATVHGPIRSNHEQGLPARVARPNASADPVYWACRLSQRDSNGYDQNLDRTL